MALVPRTKGAIEGLVKTVTQLPFLSQYIIRTIYTYGSAYSRNGSNVPYYMQIIQNVHVYKLPAKDT